MTKKSNNNKCNQNQNIRVFVRCRPINSAEKKQHSPSVVSIIPDKKQVIVKEKINDRIYSKKYSFDKVFGPETEQVDVYLAVVQPLIEEVLMGYNCTVFAYGQTGTGKTYTMEGERHSSNCSWEEDPAAGIIPRSLHQLFEVLTKETNVEFSVRVSFMELYNEELFDLLSPSEELTKLRLFEDSTKKGSIMIQGLEETDVHSKDEVYAILEKGTSRRQTAATMMNASSSRSHTVFSVTIRIKENTADGEELFKTGKLNLVDLAGSENIGRSGAVEKRAREAGNINQSLLTLGRVITALVEKAPHVPYRESKLTRLLKDSLGGRTKTSIIATISPALCNIDETNSTLDYAHRAKDITNKPEVNQRMTKHAIIKEYTEEIERLRRDLAASRDRHGVCLDPQTYKSMRDEMISRAEELKELQNQLDAMEEQKSKMENLYFTTKEELHSRHAKLDEQCEKKESLNSLLQNASQQLNFTQKALCKVALGRDEKDHLISAQMKTEKKLSQQARMVLEAADQSAKDVYTLHEKIARQNAVEQKNEESAEEFKTAFQQQLRRLDDMSSQAALEFTESSKDVGGSIVVLMKYCAKQQQQMSSCFNELTALQNSRLDHLSSTSNPDTDVNKIWKEKIIKKSDSNMKKHSAEYHNFLDKKCAVLFKKVQQIIDSIKYAIPKIQKSVLEKLTYHEDAVQKFWNQQKIEIVNLREYYNEFIKKQNERLQCCIEKPTTISTEYADFYKEINAHIHTFQLTCDSVMAASEIQKQKVAAVYGEIKKELDCSLSSSVDTSNKMESYIASMINSTKGFVEGSVAFSQDASNFFEDQLSTVHTMATSLSETLSEMQSEVVTFWSTSEQEQNEEHEMLKNEIENQAMVVGSQFQGKLACIGEMRSAWEVIQSDQECQGEVSYKEYEKYSNDQLELLHEIDAKRDKLVKTVKNEIVQTNLGLEEFLTDGLQKDIPTGETPKRKDYIYPKILACTSPHERILERSRLQRESGFSTVLLPPDENLECKDECQFPVCVEKDSACYTSDDSNASGTAQSLDCSVMGRSYTGKENQQNSDYKSSRPRHQIPLKTLSKKVPVLRKPFKNTLNK